MSSQNDSRQEFTRQLDEFRALSHEEQQRLYDEEGRHQKRVFWLWWFILTVFVVFLASKAFAEVGQDDIEAAKTQAAASMTTAWKQGTEAKEQPVQKTMAKDGSLILSQNAPRRIVMTPDGPGLSDRHTTITVIQQPAPTPAPRPIIRPKEKATLNHDIHGDNFSASLVIPEDTTPEALQVLQAESNNITDRYREKLSILNEKNVMAYNTEMYKVTTARQTALGWLTLPLIVVCSLCGVYIFRAVTHDRRERLKVELGAINERR